jgi:hypothetical protein
LGKRIRENPEGPWREIIGVVGDVFDDGVHARAPVIAYWPALMESFEGERIRVRRAMTLTIRSGVGLKASSRTFSGPSGR